MHITARAYMQRHADFNANFMYTFIRKLTWLIQKPSSLLVQSSSLLQFSMSVFNRHVASFPQVPGSKPPMAFLCKWRLSLRSSYRYSNAGI
ncbi:hypothetical protein VNO77_34000 [Canavalia gladiata]|uniref:Uncharacterized protein n=1 Tax=Canavalia gladiata TaxID=3824 RepID=A0AAN9Q1D2_CANGL